jgi:hypothetical protein
MISNCVLVGNNAWYQGGGAAWGSFYDCTIKYNTASETSEPTSGGGGGTFRSSLYGCQLNSNRCFFGTGGGTYGDTTTVVSNCYIAGNTVGTGGGGNPAGGGGHSGFFYNCTVTVNRSFGAPNFGGGLGLTGPGSGSVFDSVISGNSSANFSGVGAGIYASNCIISDNSGFDSSAGGSGTFLIDCTVSGGTHGRGAAYGYASPGFALRTRIVSNVVNGTTDGGGARSVTLTNCLIAYNSSTGPSAGGAERCKMVNCTVVENTGSGGAVGGISGGVDGTNINGISRNNTGADDTGGTTIYSAGEGAQYSSGTGNITSDPLFVDSAAGNFRLQGTSPSRDTGTNLLWTANDLDLDRESRLRSVTVDMGAFELQTISTVVYQK